MKAWSDWEIIRRQVAIGGRIVDKGNKPLSCIQVAITSMPDKYKVHVEGVYTAKGVDWVDLEERPDRALSRSDGIYYFLDLTEGPYTLRAMDPRSGKYGEKRVSVSKDKKKNINMIQADFKLSI